MFRIDRIDGQLCTEIRNGAEALRVPRTYVEGAKLVIAFETYDARLTAEVSPDGRRMDGEWSRRLGQSRWAKLPFHAVAGESPRFETAEDVAATAGKTEPAVDGRWAARFEGTERPAVAVFRTLGDGTVEGTVLLPTGDLRRLSGALDGRRLRLSRFDGAHALLFDLDLGEDGELRGTFSEGDFLLESWSARRDADAAVPDAFRQLAWAGPIDLEAIEVFEANGTARRLSDPLYIGRATIIELLGTWCPNCYDSTAYLQELYRRHRQRGLAVIGLAFEMTDDFERNAEQLRRYRDHHAVEYPLLLAWKHQMRSPAELFPTVRGEFAFPSLIFLDGRGEIRGTYKGFVGPAATDDHARMRLEIEAVVETLLQGP